VLRTHGFGGNTNRPHVVYRHEEYGDVRVNVPKPHEGEKHVKPVYVGDALAAIDEVARRDADKEKEA